MGGNYYVDLRSDVKYLIVGDKFTEKYFYCIKNRYDIIFLKQSAIELIYRQFKNDNKFINLGHYKLQIFENLKICLSNLVTDDLFDNDKYLMNELINLITINGGIVSNNLAVNHHIIITNVSKGKRYLKAIDWKIPVIHPRFLLDSIRRAASVDPKDYLLDDYPNYPELMSASEAHDLETGENMMIDTFKSNSMIDPLKDLSKLKIKKNKQIWDSIMHEEPKLEIKSKPVPPKEVKSTIFNQLKFKLVNFSPLQVDILTNIIVNNDGDVVTEECDYLLVPFGIQKSDLNSVTSLHGSSVPIKTEWMVERSIYYNRFVDDAWSDPIKAVNHKNNHFDISLSGFKGIELLHLTKLSQLLGFHINENFNSKISLLVINIKIFELKLPTNLFYNQGLLDCGFNSINYVSTKNKILAAKNWKIPIISINYLFEIVSRSTDVINYPPLKDLDWCLYYPVNKANALIEFLSTAPEDDSLKMPSPKKIKRKFGKLVTTNEKLTPQNSVIDNNEEVIDDLNFNLDIGYDNKRRKA